MEGKEKETPPEVILDRLIKNEPVEIEIPGIGTIRVRAPTIGDQIEAFKKAIKLEIWNSLDLADKADYINAFLVERTIDLPIGKNWKNLKLAEWRAIVEVVTAWRAKIERELADKRRNLIRNFLGLTQENIP